MLPSAAFQGLAEPGKGPFLAALSSHCQAVSDGEYDLQGLQQCRALKIRSSAFSVGPGNQLRPSTDLLALE